MSTAMSAPISQGGVFVNAKEQAGLSVKLWRGERMCLIGMDVANPEPDFVGFSIEVEGPEGGGLAPLGNRLNFAYAQPAVKAVTGRHDFDSREAPFQKFRWVHFPRDPKGGKYTYRITKQHMPRDAKPVPGTSLTLDIPLDPTTYDDFLDVGFTRNFASSQAYADKYGNNPKIIPAKAVGGLKFKKVPGDVYQWLGFEAYDMIFGFLDECVQDPTIQVDFFAYDLNEPDIVGRLAKLGPRLRAIIDNSGEHAPPASAESQAAVLLGHSAGAANVHRMHFKSLQHNKVFIAKRNGQAFKVLFGSTNFSFRGIYIQANNVLVFTAPEAAGLFETAFQKAFNDPKNFAADPISTQWHVVNLPGKPTVHFCFSPHADPDLSLNPLGGAIDQATSSVFFAIAFLYQTRSGATREAINRLMTKRVFSYGISDSKGDLHLQKPDGSVGIVDFAYMAQNAPQPFKREWSGGSGIHEHNKFVVTDFNLPSAKVFTGSSNLSPSGEKGNGDNLVMIEDQRVAAAYAIQALLLFDHFHFRLSMQDAKPGAKKARGKKAKPPNTLTLQKPTALSGKPAWFEEYYRANTQKEKDRLLFSH